MKKTQKQLDTEFEQVEAMGGDGKAAVEATKSIMTAEVKKQEEEKNRSIERLDAQAGRSTIKHYHFLLADMLIERLKLNVWPQGWFWRVAPTDEGVLLELCSPSKRFFLAGFKATGIGKYDFNAIDLYAERAQNTVDNLTNSFSPTYGRKKTQ